MNKREPYKNNVVDKRLVKEKERENSLVSSGQLSKKNQPRMFYFWGTIHNLAHALSERETREKNTISPSKGHVTRDNFSCNLQRNDDE